jgi:hypothetical protein
MKKILLALCLLVSTVAADFTLDKTSLVFNESSPLTMSQNVQLTSTETSTLSVSFQNSGTTMNWLSISPSTLSVPSLSANSFAVTATIPAGTNPGVYSGSISVIGNNGTTTLIKPIQVTVNPTNYVYSQQFIVAQGKELDIDPMGYRFQFTTIGSSAAFTLYYGQNVEQDGWELTTDRPQYKTAAKDVRISLVQAYTASNKAILQVDSTDSHAVVSLRSSGSVQFNSLATTPVKHTIYRYQSDPVTTITDNVTNNYAQQVSIDQVLIEPDASWIQVGSLDLQPLNPGQSLGIQTILTPSKAPIGTSQATLTIYGKLGGQTISVSIPYQVTIQGSNLSITSDAYEMRLQAPAFAQPFTPFVIALTNVQPGDLPMIDPYSLREGDKCDPASSHVAGSTWTAQCTLYTKDTYRITVRVLRNMVPVAVLSKTIMVGSMADVAFSYSPELMPGVKSTIGVYLVSENKTILENQSLIINSQLSPDRTLTPESGQTYQICVELGSDQKCESKQVNYRLMEVQVSPLMPAAGDTVTVTATDQLTRQGVGINLKMGGATLQNPFVASEGTMSVSAEALGYEPRWLNIQVTKKPIVAGPSNSVKVGDDITLSLGKNISWQLVFGSNSTPVAQGTSDSVRLTEYIKTYGAGTYTVNSNGIRVTALEVQDTQIWEQTWFQAIAAIVVLVLVAVGFTVYKANYMTPKKSDSANWGAGEPALIDDLKRLEEEGHMG